MDFQIHLFALPIVAKVYQLNQNVGNSWAKRFWLVVGHLVVPINCI